MRLRRRKSDVNGSSVLDASGRAESARATIEKELIVANVMKSVRELIQKS